MQARAQRSCLPSSRVRAKKWIHMGPVCIEISFSLNLPIDLLVRGCVYVCARSISQIACASPIRAGKKRAKEFWSDWSVDTALGSGGWVVAERFTYIMIMPADVNMRHVRGFVRGWTKWTTRSRLCNVRQRADYVIFANLLQIMWTPPPRSPAPVQCFG